MTIAAKAPLDSSFLNWKGHYEIKRPEQNHVIMRIEGRIVMFYPRVTFKLCLSPFPADILQYISKHFLEFQSPYY